MNAIPSADCADCTSDRAMPGTASCHGRDPPLPALCGHSPDRPPAPNVHTCTACTNSRFEFCTPCILNLADFCPSSRCRNCPNAENKRTRDKTCRTSPDRPQTATSPFLSKTIVIVACETHVFPEESNVRQHVPLAPEGHPESSLYPGYWRPGYFGFTPSVGEVSVPS